MLDNVIDYNYYSVDKAFTSNNQHRPIGLGILGFQDALYMLGIPYDSPEAVDFADYLQEVISYYAISASCDLARERGAYSTFEGSLWSKGILPIDSLQMLTSSRADGLLVSNSCRMPMAMWDDLRDRVKKYGMRNSNVMAIAPTATISNICGVSQSIEPTYQNVYVKSNLSGEFITINTFLVDELKKLGLWNNSIARQIINKDGSVQDIIGIPAHIKALFKTAFEIDSVWLINAASRRQKWIDQGQSLNLYMKNPSGKKLNDLYTMAWMSGLKSTYYLRTMAATGNEKTIDESDAIDVTPATDMKFCSIDNPDCESCQ
jgi:ribonucleoside-diphosphate reductase alpha chain